MRRPRKPVSELVDDATLALLACPACHAALVTSRTLHTAQEIVCTGCTRRYPVRDGLAVLIASAAIE